MKSSTPKRKLKKVKETEGEPFKSIKKLIEFKYVYAENAQRIAFAHAMSCHFVKIRMEGSSYIVEIYS